MSDALREKVARLIYEARPFKNGNGVIIVWGALTGTYYAAYMQEADKLLAAVVEGLMPMFEQSAGIAKHVEGFHPVPEYYNGWKDASEFLKKHLLTASHETSEGSGEKS